MDSEHDPRFLAALDAALKRATEQTEEDLKHPRLAKRSVPGLSRTVLADRLAAKLWLNSIRYDSGDAATDAYEEWWFSLSDELRQAIDQRAKSYDTFSELVERCVRFAGPGPIVREPASEPLYRTLQVALPKVNRRRFDELLTAPIKEQSEFAKEFGRRSTKVVRQVLGVKSHRAPSNSYRD